jgi:hypothetical protein
LLFITYYKLLGLLLADDLAVGTTTSIGKQRAINNIKEYCEEWKLKINTNKTKIVVFKKGGKLSKYENCKLGGEETEVANEIKYLGIILDGRGKREKEKRQVVITGETALNSINMCLARAPNMGINMLEQLYVSLIESRMMTGVEIWGLDDGWREIGKVHEMFCKRIMGAPTAAASGACVKKLRRTNRKEKCQKEYLNTGKGY